MRLVKVTEIQIRELDIPKRCLRGHNHMFHYAWVDGRRFRRQLRRAGVRV